MAKDTSVLISDDKSLLQLDIIHGFLQKSNWATRRPKKTIARSIESAASLCFGAYVGEQQVAFARVVTDGCTFAYLCDVFVDEQFRDRGISKNLMEKIMHHPNLQGLRRFTLATESAHGLYEKYGFHSVPADKYMEIINDDY